MPILADSHVHLDDPRFDDDRGDVLARARRAGLNTLIIPGVDAASWTKLLALHHAEPGVYVAYGLHPMFLARHQPCHLDTLKQWLVRERPVAVGEIGLDFHAEGLDAETQRQYFHRQLELAREHDLPVIVHARRALDEVIHTLRRFDIRRGVVHSFSGSEQQARQLWQLGMHLGIGGPVTHARAQRLQRIVANMPIEHLLLESDAPDQPGAGHRGQRNEPAFITETLRCIARLRDEAEDAIAAATLANTRRLFGLDARADT
ncbi:TatD family hydrolase [Rhodanobacter glycinis]|uniref:TatD DNase family protein n=1 Tax=Rhodanobacter glycinis TaxID=582702 RepID=A0A1I3XZY3_9GAMM|nr:TatD family hydrolase [Rhodanobacter glycinis]SFK24769.1 TatD DNase family protein [Rhodanobacter glycinis]